MKNSKDSQVITIIANIISLIVSIFISFFIAKYIVEYIGKEAYSFYPTANNVATYFSLLFMATNALSSRLIIIPFNKNDLKEAQSYYSTTVITSIVISVIVFILEYIFYINMENILEIPTNILSEVKTLFMLIFAGSIVSGIGSSFASVYYVKNRMDLYAISVIIENLSKGLIIFVLMLLNKISLVSFGIIIFISTTLRYLSTFIFAKTKMSELKLSLSSFSLDKLKQMLKLGLLSIISNSGNLLIINSMLIVSNNLLGINESSELSLVQSFVTVSLLLGNTITTMLEPQIINGVIDNDNSLIMKSNIILLTILVIPTIMIACLGKQFYSLWLPNENYNTLYILSLLSCLLVLISNLSYIYNSSISTLLMEKVKAIGTIGMIIIYILFIFIFSKLNNLNNISILSSALIAYISYFLLYLPITGTTLLNKNNKTINFNYLKNICFVIILIVINYFICSLFKPYSFISFILMCLLSLLMNYSLLYLLYKDNVTDILKNNK